MALGRGAGRVEVARFGSKNNFWRAVVDHAMGAMQARFSLVFELDADDYEKLESIIRAFYSVAASDPQMNRILAAEFVLDSAASTTSSTGTRP